MGAVSYTHLGVVKHAEAAVMAVDDAPLRVGGKQTAQLAQIAGEVIVLPDGQLIDCLLYTSRCV